MLKNLRPKKYVLTGSVCVGKTTVIDLLSEQGFATFPEFSRALINEELKKKTVFSHGQILLFFKICTPRSRLRKKTKSKNI